MPYPYYPNILVFSNQDAPAGWRVVGAGVQKVLRMLPPLRFLRCGFWPREPQCVLAVLRVSHFLILFASGS